MARPRAPIQEAMNSVRLPARALLAGCLVLTAALATPRLAVATDLESLRRRAQSVADEVSALGRRLAELDERRDLLAARIADASRDIAALELAIHRAEADHAAARERYVASAVEVYKEGTSTRLALLLSARNVAELASMARAATEVAELDVEALSASLEAGEVAARAQRAVDERKQGLLADQARVQALSSEFDATLAERSAVLGELNARVAELEAEARRRAELAAARAQAEAAAQAAELAQALEPDASGAGPAQDLPPGFAGTGVTFEGIASWYGPGFEGDSTANGEIFDPEAYTAASKELPFGTWLYVSYEGRGVIVRINDRGPYIKGRILDLSAAAAQAIGLGVGWVEVEILIKS
jgi:peptidoglycan hydrolase CwlO-like protein/3D (Asp-Asp-Asp) domain-containing protein